MPEKRRSIKTNVLTGLLCTALVAAGVGVAVMKMPAVPDSQDDSIKTIAKKTGNGNDISEGESAEVTTTAALKFGYADINSVSITVNDAKPALYTGSPVEPVVDVKIGKEDLEQGRDFVVEFSNNVDEGVANASVIGIGRFSGHIDQTFAISKDGVSTDEIRKAHEEQAKAGDAAASSPAAAEQSTPEADSPDSGEVETSVPEQEGSGEAAVVQPAQPEVTDDEHIDSIPQDVFEATFWNEVPEEIDEETPVKEEEEDPYAGEEASEGRSNMLLESISPARFDPVKVVEQISVPASAIEEEVDIVESSPAASNPVSETPAPTESATVPEETPAPAAEAAPVADDAQEDVAEEVFIEDEEEDPAENTPVVTPTPKTSLKDAKVTNVSKRYYYSGSKIRPVPVVKIGGKKLKAGRDYTISYKNTIKDGTGSGTVTIKGKGDYTGKKAVTYKIENLGDDLARKACELSYSRGMYYQNGKYPGTRAFVDAAKAANCYSSPYYGRSCVFGICTAIRASGYDKGFPRYNWDSNWNVKSSRSYFHYLQVGEKSSNTSQKSKRWAYVGTYPKDKDKLLPGDVLLVLHANGRSTTNHIWMYVGSRIPQEVYKTSIKGRGARNGDLGKPQGSWVSSHAAGGTAALGIGNEKWSGAPNYIHSANPIRIYRCTNPACK